MAKKNSAAKSFASAILNSTTEPTVNIVINGKPATMKLSDFMAAQTAAQATPTTATPAPTVVKPDTKPAPVAPVTSADFENAGKVATCYSAARANVKAVAPWNGVKGKGSVGGRYSLEGIAAFKAGYNAKAKELGIPVKY
jgi:hypothetical protein